MIGGGKEVGVNPVSTMITITLNPMPCHGQKSNNLDFGYEY